MGASLARREEEGTSWTRCRKQQTFEGARRPLERFKVLREVRRLLGAKEFKGIRSTPSSRGRSSTT